MGLLNNILSWFGLTTSAAAPAAPGARTYPQRQGATRDESSLLAMYAVNPELRTPVKAIARAFAGVDFYAVDGSGEQVASDHPLAEMLTRPCADYSGRTMLALISTYVDLTGDVFILLSERDGRVSLLLLPPPWVSPTLEPDGSTTYTVQYPGGAHLSYTDAQIVWMREADPANPYGRGGGSGWAAADEVDGAEAASGYTTGFFRNGARPEALVHLPGATADQVRAARDQYIEQHQGMSYGLEFIGGPRDARMEIERLSTDFEDLGVVELRQRLGDIIRRLYGVPPELVGQLDHSNRATIQAALSILGSLVIDPRAQWLCEEINSKLIPRAAAMLPARQARALSESRLCARSVVPEDDEARREVMQAQPEAFTVNEWRTLAGLPAREGGDVYLREADKWEEVAAGDVADMTKSARFEGWARGKHPTPPALPKIDGDTPVIWLAVDNTTKALSQQDVGLILRALQPERLALPMSGPLQQTLDGWMRRAAAEPGVGLELDDALINPFVAQYLEEFGERNISEMTVTTRDALTATLTEGVRQGEGMAALTARVSSLAAFAPSRAELIARTETLRAANAARLHAYRLSPAVTQLQWVATMDRRTRPNHAALNGQVREVDTPFGIGGQAAAHPGAFGSPSMDCRCRCTIVAHFPDQARSVAQLGATWKTFDEELEGDDARAIAAAQAGLDAQRDDIIAAIERAFAAQGAA